MFKHITRTTGRTQTSTLLRFSLAMFIGWLVLGCNEDPLRSSKPAPWTDQLTIAVRAAAQVDSSAKLTTVMADPTNGLSSDWDYETGSWDLSFHFRGGTSGKEMTITFRDTAITSTEDIKLETPIPYTPAPSVPTPVPIQAQSLSQLLATVKLGPREAGSITWKDAQAQASQRGITVYPGFYLAVRPAKKEWLITYRSTKRGPLDLHWDLSYVVDATTGEILERNYEPPDFGR